MWVSFIYRRNRLRTTGKYLFNFHVVDNPRMSQLQNCSRCTIALRDPGKVRFPMSFCWENQSSMKERRIENGCDYLITSCAWITDFSLSLIIQLYGRLNVDAFINTTYAVLILLHYAYTMSLYLVLEVCHLDMFRAFIFASRCQPRICGPQLVG